MFNIRLETKNITPEQIHVRDGDDGHLVIDIPAGPWTRQSVAYSTAYAVMDHVHNGSTTKATP